MRMILLCIAITGCAADDTSGDTLGSGTLASVTWGGGLCQASYACSGGLEFSGASFYAWKLDGDADEVARGELTQSTRNLLDHFVASIPLSEPTGVFEDDGGDGGRVELTIRRGDETRIYYTAGFRGDFGVYVADVRTAIGTCQTDVATYTSCTPQP
jgi:hypothetical protein